MANANNLDQIASTQVFPYTISKFHACELDHGILRWYAIAKYNPPQIMNLESEDVVTSIDFWYFLMLNLGINREFHSDY